MVEPVTAIGASVANSAVNRIMADDPNSKTDDQLLELVLGKEASRVPIQSRPALLAVLKQLTQNAADVAGATTQDLKSRATKLLESTGLLVNNKLDVEKLKDTKKLEVLSENIRMFLQQDYAMQGKRAESEIGLDTSARRGVASSTSFFGWLGNVILKIGSAVGAEPESLSFAKRWVDEAETYTARPIKSGKIREDKPNLTPISALSTERYDQMINQVSGVYLNGQPAIRDMSVRAAAGSQQTADASIGAGTIVHSSPKAAAPAAPSKGEKPADPKLNIDLLSSTKRELTEPPKGWFDRAKNWLFGSNKSDVQNPAAKATVSAAPSPKVDGPKLELSGL